MSIVHRRLLLIVAVATCLSGLTGTGALAGMSLGSNPSTATQNSIWNITATWQDDDGAAPVLDRAPTTEAIMDYGLSVDGWGPTIGTPRGPVPAEWSDALRWYPAVPAPDGFIGFPVPFDENFDPLQLPGEQYEAFGYASIQPDPEEVNEAGIETHGDAGFEHAVDLVIDERVPMRGNSIQEVGWPLADFTLPLATAGREVSARSRDETRDPIVPSRPKTPAFIQTSKVPVMLVGVWSDAAHMRPIKCRLTNAATLKPVDLAEPLPKENGWPSYNIIEVLEPDTVVSSISNYYVSYYTPGTNYVITGQAPLPMPYTVYRIPLAIDGDGTPYLPINDGILHLDPKRIGDLNNPALSPDASPVLGIYANPEGPEGDPNAVPPVDPTNYFDLTAPEQPAVRYEAPNAPGTFHPTFGKLYFTTTPPDVTPGKNYYVVVSTDAVDGVYPSEVPSDADNLYINPDENAVPRKIGYCAKSGVIRLAVPAADPVEQSVGTTLDGVEHKTYTMGQQLWTKYRKLSSNTFTVGQTNEVGLLSGFTSVAPYNKPFSDGVSSVDGRIGPPTPQGQGKFTLDTKSLPVGTYAAGIRYWPVFPMVNAITGTLDRMGVVWYKGSIPMRYKGPNGITEGAAYGVSVSAGLKMNNREQWPSADVTLNHRTLNNKLIYDEFGWPMYYDSALTGSEAPPSVRRITCVGYGTKNRQLLVYEVKASDNVNVTVHSGATALHCYSDSAAMPTDPDVDPLAVEPLEEANPAHPDDGSGSTQFVFRIRYVRNSGVGVLPPMPWLRWQADPWNPYTFNSGVVLYLDEKGTGDYKPHFMYPDYEDNPGTANDGMGANIYMYRVIPHSDIRLVNTPRIAPWPFQMAGVDVDTELYQSLQMGVYRYYFGTSSDSLRFVNIRNELSSYAFENQNPNPMDPNDPFSKTGLEEWGQIGSSPFYSTGLDPTAPRAVNGYPRVDRAAGRRFSTDGQTPRDTSLYVNMSVRAPGLFEGIYKYPYVSNDHPRVSCELHMPSTDEFFKRYDHVDYGEGRFFGTLFPFRTALNPAHSGMRGGGTNALLAETSGSYSTDTNVFRIMYKQLDNKAPVEIKVWINNASEKSGTTPGHQYTAYTMQRRPDQTNPNYRTGVWYEYKLQSGSAQLPYGPHTYYFTANDGEHTVRWPVRPDQYTYNWPGPNPDATVMNMIDNWVPTASYWSEHRNEGYIDNDYVPGPYVNRAPVITNVSVTPSAGKEGTHFVYKATYADPDGQRPYSASIVIQWSDGAPPRTFALRPDPKYNIDPIADNSALYKAGVDYILDTATIADFALDTGVRRYYVTFTDDWGQGDDVNDRRIGEPSRYPAGEGNWVQGPVISGNTPPTLSGGEVSSTDNTSNAATVWKFKVNYRDLDRDPPALIKVFIGRLQPQDITTPTPSNKVKTIVWDSGHTMLPTNPSDTVYTHGVEFAYQTRLAGPDTAEPQMVTKQMTISSSASQIDPDPNRTGDIIRIWKVYTAADPNYNYYSYSGTPPNYTTGMITLNGSLPAGDIWIQYERRPAVQYYYAFEAFDGVDYATYKNSSDPNVRSDAAHCFILQDAESVDSPTNLHYKVRPKIAKPITLTAATSVLDPDPQRTGDIIRIWGVYANENLTGTNYYPLPAGQNVPADYDNVTHPTITLSGVMQPGKIWLLVEADTPMVGPMPIAAPAPAGVIPDPEVFINFQQNGKPELITDEKNGYIDELTGAVDHAVVFMGGEAAREGRPSSQYVAPDVPEDIASVEGVYWLSNPDISHQYDNYYDPALLYPPMMRPAVQDPNFPQVFPEQPEEIYKVLGVYDNPALTGINYYTGDQGQLKWQPADTVRTFAGGLPNIIWPSNPNDIAVIQGVYLSMNVNDAAGNFCVPDGDSAATFVVPADVNIVTGDITINPTYNTAGMIKKILRINEQPDMSGQDYFISVDPAGDPYDPAVPLRANQPEGAPQSPAVTPVYVSYVPDTNFGPDREFLALRKELPQPVPQTVYIAYYAPGDLNGDNGVDLAIAPPQPDMQMYVKIWAKGFNPGDRYIKLTKPLPDLSAAANVINSGIVRPDAGLLADIGTVTGVYVEGDSVNYYENTANPFKIGDTDVFLGTVLPAPLAATATVKYLPRERNVTIKYSDMRFTHTFSGTARQITGHRFSTFTNDMLYVNTSTGTTHFRPDGVTAGNINITGNAPIATVDGPDVIRDIDGGIVGIWQFPEFTGPNYFNPRRTSLYKDNPSLVRLSTEAAVGTDRMYARAYQKGVYFLDRWNRNLRFETTKTLSDLDRVQVSYFFGTKMSQVLVPNTLPVLTEGAVSPISGSRNTQYVYSVKYQDSDGPTGQMPAYVRVFIDGVPFDMAVPNQGGTPNYREGVIFTYTPTGGLSGKPHTFYFEASDGGAVAWFDKLGSHNTERTIDVQDIVELDGPWVDDPPTLTNGLVTPNPTGQGAGIGTTESVDYTVTLTDLDNEPPYTFDPLRDIVTPDSSGLTGPDVSGSPRVWIDAGLTDDTAPPATYWIVGLEADPSDVTKMRVVRVASKNASGDFIEPGWTTDQFAGKLLQISNGKDWTDVSPSPYSAVYLIQSNTSNKLVLAAENLANDKVYPVPPDPTTGAARWTSFRINGLLMTKANPSQVDNWATGVDYKVTVPRLQVGLHRFRFTARTREDKPDWLLSTPGYIKTQPYSDMVRFPALGDATGPNVISKPPADNVAPVLSRVVMSSSETLYRGPQAQYATVTAANSATPSDYVRPKYLLGVYRNANFDAHLDPNAALAIDQPKDFLNLAGMPKNPPDPGSPVALAPNLYPCPDTMLLVQKSSAVENTTTVVPDVASAIGSVVGVYLASDTTLLHRYDASPTLTADNKVTLTEALPMGTSEVYITYYPKVSTTTVAADGTGNLTLASPNAIAYIRDVYLETDAGKTNLIDPATWVPGTSTSIAYTGAVPPVGTNVVVDYVAWPPVYIKFYAQEPAGSPVGNPKLHRTFRAGEPLTFVVFYRDANGDRPTYHDGVQGYVKLVFNNGRTAQLSALAPPVDYKVGVPFGATLTDVPPGIHPYHFEASDGYVVTRFPAEQAGVAPDERVQVNNKPVLSNGGVDHSSGATTFTFSVTYADADNSAPASGGFVKALLTSVADPTLVIGQVTMSTTGTTWTTGVVYTGVLDARTHLVGGQPVGLPVGSYTVQFVANDGTQDADPLAGPTITVRAPDPDHHPFISYYQVNKLLPGGDLDPIGVGKTSDTFVYRARYKDSYDEAPVFVQPGGGRLTALSLIIDGNFASPIPMTMVPMTGTPDYTGSDLVRWPWWEARVTGRTLKGGNHTYTVRASDGTVSAVFETGVPDIKYGPTLMIPYFALQVVGKDGSTVSGGAIVGQEVLIKGQMYFPYIQGQPDLKPTDLDNIVIQVTKPDNTIISLGGTLTVRDFPVVGDTSTNWVGDIEVVYSGYVDPALATGSSLTLVASGKWVVDASWVGDATYDGARTDTTFDQTNDQVQIQVNGPSRTVATNNPLQPESSAPVVDMITPPMMIGSTSPSSIFGADRALSMQIVKWAPDVGQYYRYDVGGYFPPLRPGDAVWIKPKLSAIPGTGYPAAEMVARDAVEGGWTMLDNPAIQNAEISDEPYLSRNHRLIKVLAQAYPLKTDASGTVLLDNATQLPLLRPCSIALSAGWNQFGCIFFNWKRSWQIGTTEGGELPPPPPGGPVDFGQVTPSDTAHINRVLGVYTTPSPTVDDINYYQPGVATTPYAKNDAAIQLTRALPPGVTTVYILYEEYPKADVGIPISEVQVTYLGVKKTLAEAKTAGWITDYAWRYDSTTNQYVAVSETRAGAERVLKAWSGYWIRAYVNCALEINPDTRFNGATAPAQAAEAPAVKASASKGLSVKSVTATGAAPEEEEMLPPPPAPRN